MPIVYCGYIDCIHNKITKCNQKAIVIGKEHEYCDEYKKKKCQHNFKCTKCGIEAKNDCDICDIIKSF